MNPTVPQTSAQAPLFKEISPLSASDCFIVMERQKTRFDFPVHVHPEFELNYIENAAGARRIVGDSVETITEQELVLVANPRLEHAWVNHECRSTRIYEVTMQFHPSLATGGLWEKAQFGSIGSLFVRAQRGLSFTREAIARVRPLIRAVCCEADGFYAVMRLLEIMHELSLAPGSRELASEAFTPGIPSDAPQTEVPQDASRIDRVVEWMNANYDQPLRLSDAAEAFNMSEPSFCRFVRQHTSRSFVEMLTEIRVGNAARLLVDSTLPVAEIGFVCGFNNLSNFNRVFRNRKGMPPSHFRQNYRKLIV